VIAIRKLRAMAPFRFLPSWPLTSLYLVLISLGFYAVWIEPFWIRVSHFRLTSPLIHAPLKIAHLSDLHTHGLRLRERRMLKLLAKENPDVILVTGDSIIDSSNYHQVAEVLRELHAPLGVWMVRGNWENAMKVMSSGLRGIGSESEFYRANGVHLLVNAAVPIRDDIWLIGLDEMSYGRPNLTKALAGVPPGVYRIALFHVPQYFDRVAGHAELALAGHCHGGQVVLPGFAPFYLPAGCKKYLAGWYERDGSRMYITRGIGNTMLDIRFNAPPEMEIFDLEPAN